MKKGLFVLGFAIMVEAGSASAMVVDKLMCDLDVTVLESGQKASSSAKVNLVRKVSQNAGSDRVLTQSNGYLKVAFHAAGYQVSTGVGMMFDDGVLLDATQQVLDSRQNSCISPSMSWCKEDDQHCMGESVACARNADPFDSINGWQKVNIISGTKIPQFDPTSVSNIKYSIRDQAGVERAQANLQCSYIGTDYDVAANAIAE